MEPVYEPLEDNHLDAASDEQPAEQQWVDGEFSSAKVGDGPTPAPDVLASIVRDLASIADNDVNERFTPPRSRLTRGALEERLTVEAPNFDDELERLSGQRLSAQQLASVADSGKFEVDSEDFPAQPHVWETNHLIQKGRLPTFETLLDNLASAVHLWIIFVPERLWRGDSRLSLRNGLWNVVRTLWSVPLLLIGPAFRAARSSTEDECRNRLLFERLLGLTTVESRLQYQDNLPDVATLRDGTKISLRLVFPKPLREPLYPVVARWEREWDADMPRRRSALIKELGAAGQDGLPQRVADEEQRRYREALHELIRATLPAQGAQECLDLLVALELVRGCVAAHDERRREARDAYQRRLVAENPIRGRLYDWVEAQVDTFMQQWDAGNVIEKEVRDLLPRLPAQQRFLLKTHLDLTEEVAAAVVASTTVVAAKEFEWRFRIWRSSHWRIIEENFSTQSARYFRLEKTVPRTTTTYWPFWRWRNMIVRSGYFANNGAFYMVANCIFGPFGFRSMVGLDDFQPDRDIDSTTGELRPCGPEFATWIGRIRNLWRHITKARRDFESAPDRGFFGKGFIRPFHAFWNYVAKGLVGTIFALVIHPLLFIINSVFSVVAFATSPIWAVLGAIIVFLFSIFIYDVDSDYRSFFPLPRMLVVGFFAKGLVQSVFSTGAALLGALGGVALTLGSSLRWLGRRTWDKLMMAIVIRPKARVPANNGFLTRRIGGPGLGVGYWQVVGPSTALVMVQRHLEEERMRLWRARMLEHINHPAAVLSRYCECFAAVGLTQSSSNARAAELASTARVLQKRLADAIREQTTHQLIDSDWRSSRVRMMRADLTQVMRDGENMTRQFVEGDILLNATPAQRASFWRSMELVPGDYAGLCSKMLERGFTAAVLQPVEEAEGLRLRVEHITATKYAQMLVKGTAAEIARDDLSEAQFVEPALPSGTLPPPRGVLCTLADLTEHRPPFEPWMVLFQARSSRRSDAQ